MGNINSDKIQKLEYILNGSVTPVIVTHMKPDGDALGSSTALYHYLRMHILYNNYNQVNKNHI